MKYCFSHHTDSPLLLKTTSDVEEFVSGCPPREIEASSCVLGLFGTSHESGKVNIFFISDCFVSVGFLNISHKARFV